MADFEEHAAGLRATLPRLDAPERAATELILWHEYWLRRRDFTRECVRASGRLTVIAWAKTGGFLAGNPRCSSAELTVLQLANFIAVDPFKLWNFGNAHRQAAVDAFAAALGVTSLTGEAAGSAETLAGRITTTLKAAGFDAAGEVPPFLRAFTVTEGVGATVGTSWLDASPQDRAQLLEGYAYALTADGLRVDVRDSYLYVHEPAREARDAD